MVYRHIHSDADLGCYYSNIDDDAIASARSFLSLI